MTFTTTFWNDFSIADKFGADAVTDTYNTSFKSFKNDIKYMTELCIVLNHKLWDWFHKDELSEITQTYNDLYYECYDYITENFKGDDLTYFYNSTD